MSPPLLAVLWTCSMSECKSANFFPLRSVSRWAVACISANSFLMASRSDIVESCGFTRTGSTSNENFMIWSKQGFFDARGCLIWLKFFPLNILFLSASNTGFSPRIFELCTQIVSSFSCRSLPWDFGRSSESWINFTTRDADACKWICDEKNDV